jgi:glutaminyl-peptide cyclotransferase
VVLAAHWDSQPESNFDPDPARRGLPDPGANDGASGVGVLLELMRHMEAHHVHLPFDVAVLLLDGEDGFFACYPLAGSLAFAQGPPEPVRAFVLLDMVGDPGARFPRELYSRHSAQPLQDLLWTHGQRLAPRNFVDDQRSVLDDHSAFIQAGVPSVDVIDLARADSPNGGFPPQWDTTHDTVDKLSADLLGRVGQLLLDALQDPRFEGTLS